jgi:alpha-glucosidase
LDKANFPVIELFLSTLARTAQIYLNSNLLSFAIMIIRRLLAILFIFCSLQLLASDTTNVKSPDGKIRFRIFKKGKQVCFNVYYEKTSVISTSAISLKVDNSILIATSIEPGKYYSVNETYPVFGAHSTAINHFNGLKLKVKTAQAGAYFIIDIRVFNDGAAFRQILYSGNKVITPGENTVFNVPANSIVWYHDLNMHYESVHVKKQIDSVESGEWMAPPVTFKLPSAIYASITEACLLHYSGMALLSNGKNGLEIKLAPDQPTSYPYRLRYSAEDTARLRNPAIIETPATTPWRVVVIGKDLNQLVNSDIISNLNPAPDKKLFPNRIYTSWLKPGRAVWKYLNGGGDGSPEVMKHFADQAAALGFEHNILEGFWSRWTDAELKDVINYSKKKGVGTWLWKHSKSLRDSASRDSFFKKCHDYGVTGIKIDFFDHEAKEVIDLYESILKETAAYHLMVDFHGANKPTGLSRTYPNEMTREAVKGMEASKLTDRATHETTIPFTRMIAGPAEYTVLHFGERRKNTTWAHQVASAVIISAPMLTYAANPDTILINPALPLITSIPSTWDETIVLPPSAIGECAVFARRKGTTWFLAVMNGTAPKKISIPLYFLKGNYKALIAKDGAASDSIIMEERNFASSDKLVIELVSGGGYIARFSR